MADPLIDPSDLADYWRPLSDAETVVAETLIAVASSLIRRRLPDVDVEMADGTLDRVIVAYVVTEMVKAAVDATNREVDAKSVSQGVGPYSRAITYAAARRLVFSDDLVAMLGGASASSEIGSIRLGMPVIRAHRHPQHACGQWYFQP